MPRLKPIYRLPVPGKGVPTRGDPSDMRLANILDIKQADVLLVYDVSAALRANASREVSVQIRKALRDTDLTAMVLTLRQGNFSDGPFEALATPVTFAAATGCKTVPVAAQYLAVVVTTVGSTAGVQEVEVAVVAGEE